MNNQLTESAARDLSGAELRWHAMIAMSEPQCFTVHGSDLRYIEERKPRYQRLASSYGAEAPEIFVSDHELAGRALAHLRKFGVPRNDAVMVGDHAEGSVAKFAWRTEYATGPDDVTALLRLVIIVSIREAQSGAKEAHTK